MYHHEPSSIISVHTVISHSRYTADSVFNYSLFNGVAWNPTIKRIETGSLNPEPGNPLKKVESGI